MLPDQVTAAHGLQTNDSLSAKVVSELEFSTLPQRLESRKSKSFFIEGHTSIDS